MKLNVNPLVVTPLLSSWRYLNKQRPIADAMLLWLFLCLLLARFVLPFIVHPLNHLFSDPMRHWEHGAALFSPNIISAMDPKLYQLWMFLVRTISFDTPFVVALFSGLLCAAMPWFFYKAAREWMGVKTALTAAILISVTPSLTFIYGLLMNETLTLTVLGASFWLTLRAVRKQDFSAFRVAAVSLILLSLCRLGVVPIAAMLGIYLCFAYRAHWRKTLGFVLIAITLAYLPPSLHTYRGGGSFSPFGFSAINSIYARSGHIAFSFTFGDGSGYIFQSPSYSGQRPFAPFAEYSTWRNEDVLRFTIDKSKGTDDWERTLESLPYNPEHMLYNIRDNLVFFMFGPSWPDQFGAFNPVYDVFKWPGTSEYILFNHWWWAPLLLLILLSLPWHNYKPSERLVLIITLTFCCAMILQQTGVMEGRFRKPIEPFILISIVIMATQWVTWCQQTYRNFVPRPKAKRKRRKR